MAQRRNLESYQKGLTPDEFYFDKEGVVADLLQDKLRAYVCKGVWGNIVGNDLWNIITADNTAELFTQKLSDKNSILNKIVDFKGSFLNRGMSATDSLLLLILGFKERAQKIESGSRTERKNYKDFSKELIRNGIIKDVAEVMEPMQEDVAEYKEKLKSYLRGGVVGDGNKKSYKFGWNEAEELVRSGAEDLQAKMTKLMAPFYQMAKSADNGGLDMRRAAKQIGSAAKIKEMNEGYGAMLSEYLELNDLATAIHSFREYDVKFDESLWEVFDKKFPEKKIGKETLKTIYPEQEIIIHPLVKFTNELEDKNLPLPQRSGLSVVDSGVKTYGSFMRKAMGSRFEGDPSGIMDMCRLTVSCEKTMGIGFFMDTNLRPELRRNKVRSRYEGWKPTKSLYVSDKLSMLLSFTDEEREAIKKQYKIDIPPETFRGAELKRANIEQLKTKIAISDTIYHLRREMDVEQADESYKMLEVGDPKNHDKAEYIRGKLEKLLEHKDVKEAMQKYEMQMKAPSKEEFREQVIFDLVCEGLDKLEQYVNSNSLSRADTSFKQFIYQLNKESLKSQDFRIFQKAFSSPELIKMERAIASAEKSR